MASRPKSWREAAIERFDELCSLDAIAKAAKEGVTIDRSALSWWKNPAVKDAKDGK